MGEWAPIVLDRFEIRQLNKRIKNYAFKKEIVIYVDLFRGKERICWTCGCIRLICITHDIQGVFIDFDEECIQKNYGKLHILWLRSRYETTKLFKNWETYLYYQVKERI